MEDDGGLTEANLCQTDGRPEDAEERVMEARSPRRPGETCVRWRRTIERRSRDNRETKEICV